MQTLTSHDPLAVAVTEAIRAGDLPGLRQLLAGHPGLATARITEQGEDGKGTRGLLHIATDWPGHFPRGPEVVAALVAAGADPRARFIGAHAETPLHWAASSNDVPVLDALIAAGADIEAPGAVIGGGTPLADARGFGQWRAAHRLVEHGARVTLQDAATLGLLDRVRACVEADEPPSPDEITSAFWGACHGGHLPTAQYLHQRGADPDWCGYDGMTPLDIARAQDADDVVRWLRDLGARAAPGA
ncbi:ankyrin repeat domain-containing protein [Streptomyces hawaiiensis]|uniref:ankyrin repeat domain-containing protein n=1 Tax=Streptomyces hawaiiensis TaxID=67305 RepID=UPI001FE2608E|nr:ankyrin repeat domain-containing protein [Streptomyces hawaiiensis]